MTPQPAGEEGLGSRTESMSNWLLFILGGFLSGSVMYCSLIPPLLTGKDVCRLSADGSVKLSTYLSSEDANELE